MTLLLSFSCHGHLHRESYTPPGPHQHWHIDVSYLNLAGTFYYLCSILDGYSRFIVHWEIRESMKEVDVETILQRALEHYPDARPRIISDNGPQFNDKRLHSATGYIAPADKLAGRETIIWDERDRKLEAARDLRRQRREAS